MLLVAWPLTAGSASTSLSQALSRVEKAFSEGATRHLRPLLPARGKILLSLPSLGLAEEYVSGSQCDRNSSDPFQSSSPPAVATASGAVKKKESGIESGGA